MKEKMTPWFDADVKPVRRGLYECSRLEYRTRVTRRLHWNGRIWTYAADIPYGMRTGQIACMFKRDNDKWRGLATNPSARKP